MPTNADSLSLNCCSALAKLGVKGPGAESWLRAQGIELPATTYDSGPLEDGGLIARLGAADFFLQAGEATGEIARLIVALDRPPSGVNRVERHDAAFQLHGSLSLEMLSQLCSFDFRSAPLHRVVLTRLAGINGMVLPTSSGGVPLFHLWVDGTFVEYFREVLTGIVEELGGRVEGR